MYRIKTEDEYILLNDLKHVRVTRLKSVLTACLECRSHAQLAEWTSASISMLWDCLGCVIENVRWGSFRLCFLDVKVVVAERRWCCV